MLYIRADGNAEIGTGHVMRCLSIAKAQQKNGETCTFITADTQMKPLLDEQGFFVICLDRVWNDLERETETMERLISEQNIEKLLVDSYFVTPDYLERLNRLTHLIYIDDLDEFVYPCRTLINYNLYADRLDYSARYPNTQLLIGPRYAPLREEFWNLPPRQIRKQAESVLIVTGGSDPFNIAGRLAERVKRGSKGSQIYCHIVAGRFNANIPELQTLAEKYPGVTVHQNIGNMAELLLGCDIAVSAGGSTLYEICACGTPAAVFAMADNQLAAVTAFGEGYMLNCGDYREDPEACLEKLNTSIALLAGDVGLRREIAEKCQRLVDGRGAERF